MTVVAGTAKIVKHVEHRVRLVESGGKLTAASGRQFGLMRATVYRDGLVSLEDNFAHGVWRYRKVKDGIDEGTFGYELRVTGHLASAPAYTETLKQTGTAGSARVRCRVTKDGVVARADLVSATVPAFGEAALVAARKWQFDPAMRNAQFVESDVELAVGFVRPRASAASRALDYSP